MDFDKEIFSEMVTFYGDAYHLPPLAAKIPVTPLGAMAR